MKAMLTAEQHERIATFLAALTAATMVTGIQIAGGYLVDGNDGIIDNLDYDAKRGYYTWPSQ